MSCGFSLHGRPGEDCVLTTPRRNNFDMTILRNLFSPLLGSSLLRNSRRACVTFGLNSTVIQNRLFAIIRWTTIVAATLCLLSGSLSLAQTTQSVTLAWNTDTDPTVTGYKVDYGTSSGSYTQTENVGNVTAATVSGLTAGTTYYFAVTTCHTLRQRRWSQ